MMKKFFGCHSSLSGIFLGFLMLLCLTAFTLPVMAEDFTAMAGQNQSAGLIANSEQSHSLKLKQKYQVWCYDKEGNLKWYDEFENLVPTEGLNKYLDCTLKTGCTSPIWYVFLVEGPGTVTIYSANDKLTSTTWIASTAYSVGDHVIPTTPNGYRYKCTTAGTSAATEPTWPTTPGNTVVDGTITWTTQWKENTTYSNASRPEWIEGTISGGSVDNSASKAQFNINGSATIAGAGMSSSNTKGGTASQTLIGAGDYTGGDRSVISGDTLNVQVTYSLTAS